MSPDDMSRRQAEDFLELAHTYHAMARPLLASDSLRGAIDLAYNAAELCARALLILRQAELPRTHGGLIQRCSQRIVREERLIPADVGRALNRALARQHQSPYDLHAMVTEADTRTVVQVAERLIQALTGELEGQG